MPVPIPTLRRPCDSDQNSARWTWHFQWSGPCLQDESKSRWRWTAQVGLATFPKNLEEPNPQCWWIHQDCRWGAEKHGETGCLFQGNLPDLAEMFQTSGLSWLVWLHLGILRVKPTYKSIQRICTYFQLFWCSPGSWAAISADWLNLVESCWILMNLVESCWIWFTCGEDRTYYMNLVQPMELPGASLEFRGHQAFVWEALPPRMSDVSTCPTEASFVRPVVDMLEAIKPNEGRPSGLWFNFRGRCFANRDSAYLELGSLVAMAC